MSRFFTPSMGVACLALAVALSGTAYAVTRLPINSVGTKQVINHSLQGVDFKRGTLLRGPVGQRGPQGPKGRRAPPGRPDPRGFRSTASASGRRVPGSHRPPERTAASSFPARTGRRFSTAASPRAFRLRARELWEPI